MALLEFLYKLSDQKQKEFATYNKWAYPFGDSQKEKIEEILKELVSEKDIKLAVYNYLVCKQYIVPDDYDSNHVIADEEFIEVAKKFKKHLSFKDRKDMSKYMALVEADIQVKEDLIYPNMTVLNHRAVQIEAIIQ